MTGHRADWPLMDRLNQATGGGREWWARVEYRDDDDRPAPEWAATHRRVTMFPTFMGAPLDPAVEWALAQPGVVDVTVIRFTERSGKRDIATGHLFGPEAVKVLGDRYLRGYGRPRDLRDKRPQVVATLRRRDDKAVAS